MPMIFLDAAEPFVHNCVYGVTFTAERSDLRGDIAVKLSMPLTTAQFASAVAEMVGYHAVNVLPCLVNAKTGFSGYDNLRFCGVAGQIHP